MCLCSFHLTFSHTPRMRTRIHTHAHTGEAPTEKAPTAKAPVEAGPVYDGDSYRFFSAEIVVFTFPKADRKVRISSRYEVGVT